MTATMRMGTWNIREGIGVADNLCKSKEIGRILDDVRLDILALQEVPFDRFSRSDIISIITAETDLQHAEVFPLSPAIYYPHGRSGLVVMGRSPLQTISRFLFPNPMLTCDVAGQKMVSWDKGMLVVRVGEAMPPLHVASLHGFPLRRFGREADDPEFGGIWTALADHLDELPGTAVVSGDFNTDRPDLVSSRMSAHRMRPVINGAGHTRDEILCDVSVRSSGLTVIPTFSDHPLFVADLLLGADPLWR
jgi:endonuclease/exonuclease/phosphatase family metal-dependent hydrolase